MLHRILLINYGSPTPPLGNKLPGSSDTLRVSFMHRTTHSNRTMCPPMPLLPLAGRSSLQTINPNLPPKSRPGFYSKHLLLKKSKIDCALGAYIVTKKVNFFLLLPQLQLIILSD